MMYKQDKTALKVTSVSLPDIFVLYTALGKDILKANKLSFRGLAQILSQVASVLHTLNEWEHSLFLCVCLFVYSLGKNVIAKFSGNQNLEMLRKWSYALKALRTWIERCYNPSLLACDCVNWECVRGERTVSVNAWGHLKIPKDVKRHLRSHRNYFWFIFKGETSVWTSGWTLTRIKRAFRRMVCLSSYTAQRESKWYPTSSAGAAVPAVHWILSRWRGGSLHGGLHGPMRRLRLAAKVTACPTLPWPSLYSGTPSCPAQDPCNAGKKLAYGWQGASDATVWAVRAYHLCCMCLTTLFGTPVPPTLRGSELSL